MQFIPPLILLVLPVPEPLSSCQLNTAFPQPALQARLMQLLTFFSVSPLQGLTLASVLCPLPGSTA